jgi:hypothetical protein
MAKDIVKVVGLSFRAVRVNLKPNYTVRLIPEPDNKFDPNAVKVQDTAGNMLGYVGKDDPYRPTVLASDTPIDVKVKRANYYQEGDKKLWEKVQVGDLIQLWLEVEVPSIQDSTFKKLTSFTGEEVQWSEYHHSCLDMEGNILLGGSSYMKQVVGGSFDKIAKNYADKNGLKKEDVLEYWASLMNTAGSYGTAIHKALEHYAKFEPIVGHELALPRTPHTRLAVEQFLNVSDMKNCIIEPLITDVKMGMSGWVDLLRIVGEKTVWIEDYKTAEADPIKWKKKLKEYAHQLNFYGTILYNLGYTVEKLVVWHWTGEQWDRDVLVFEPIEEYLTIKE